ncbi:hypothetical protein SDC9_124721 [bioreactor metagenome]|uniref:Glycosyltransferase 2-like domain-containing protein n=1 Tax=bioreactor metagenome TaxID=1076179 RepID=A0A645CLB7_9ZZZZ
MNKGLSIIIVNYNSTDDIRILINSIKKYESIMYDDNKIDIIIVDNGSIKLNLIN